MENSKCQGDLGESLKNQSISMMSNSQRDTIAKLETRAKVCVDGYCCQSMVHACFADGPLPYKLKSLSFF